MQSKSQKLLSSFVGSLFLAAFISIPASAQLQVGAAKEDITPPADKLPGGYFGILDHIYTRAIYVESGNANALLMNVDIGSLNATFFGKVAAEIVQATGVPMDRLIISAVHDHEAPAVTGVNGGTRGKDQNSKLFTDQLEQAMIKVATEAKANVQPAKMGFGTGRLYLNTNRDAIDPKTHLWAQEPNPDFPSDKTLAVLQFIKPNGDPIAVYMNYAMHAVSLFLHGNISGDFPEAAAHYMESVYNDKMIALWSSGAAGDQNPLYQRASHEITESRITNEMDVPRSQDPGGAEMNNALNRLWGGVNKKPPLEADPKTEKMAQTMMQAMGQLMAEEALVVISRTNRFRSDIIIHGASEPLICPGRTRIDHAREGVPGEYKDGEPVVFRLGELRIGDVAFGAVNAEIYSMIGQRLKKESPFGNTVFVTLADGQANSGYVPSDDAFARYTFQVVSTRLKPGCAEDGIVNGIVDMIEQEFAPTRTK